MELPQFKKTCPECGNTFSLSMFDPYHTDPQSGDMTFNCPGQDCLGQMFLSREEVEKENEKYRNMIIEEGQKLSAKTFKVEESYRMGQVFNTAGLVGLFIKLEMDHPERESNIKLMTDIEGNVDFCYCYKDMLMIRLPLDPEFFIKL